MIDEQWFTFKFCGNKVGDESRKKEFLLIANETH